MDEVPGKFTPADSVVVVPAVPEWAAKYGAKPHAEIPAWWRRTLSFVIDFALVGGITISLMFAASVVETLVQDATASTSMFRGIEWPIVTGLYAPPVLLVLLTIMTWTMGATPGKLVMDVRVVRTRSLLPPLLVQAVGRTTVLSVLGGLGIVWAYNIANPLPILAGWAVAFGLFLASLQRRSIDDVLTGTRVIGARDAPGRRQTRR